MKRILIVFSFFLFVGCSKESIKSELPVDYILIHDKIQVDSLEREYVLFKPKVMKAKVIIMGLHGRGGTGEELMWKTEFNQLAEKEGFIVVYPYGLNKSWVDGRNLLEEDKSANDEKFLLTLKEKLQNEFSIDTFFLFGYSNGGFMTQKMAFTHPDSFLGYASVVSTISENLNKSKPKQPIPVLFINGTEDPIVPYKGGKIKGNKGNVLGAEDTVKQWVKWNRCEVKPNAEIVNLLNDGVKVFMHTFSNCKSGKPVRFLKLEGAGHGWPGKWEKEKPGFGKFTTEISATEEIWKFFKDLPRKN